MITEVTEKDVVTETAVRQAESMECTVEIVEEVTVLRATKAWVGVMIRNEGIQEKKTQQTSQKKLSESRILKQKLQEMSKFW